MKQKQSLAFLLACCLALGASAQTIFVKADASGANNGASWADAYQTLDAAILAAADGAEIWVAKGLYTPPTAGLAAEATFLVSKPLKIYGGFAGTETALAQRLDWEANLSTLSGDLGTNDIIDDFATNRDDNARHVVTVSALVAGQKAVIDGFKITGARADSTVANAAANVNARGGGIWSTNATIEVRNCLFVQNYARNGASIYARAQSATADAGANSVIENCSFENNLAPDRAAGAYLVNMKNLLVKGCSFKNSTTNRGSLYPAACRDGKIEACLFEGNKVVDGNSAGLFLFQSKMEITDCQFTNNESTLSVAAAYNSESPSVYRRCSFVGNKCGTAGNGWGGTAVVYDSHAYYAQGNPPLKFDSCVFMNSSCSQSGGALSIGFQARVEIDHSRFEGNNSTVSGGAIWLQNDSTELIVRNTAFLTNVAGNSGGAINLRGANPLEVENCTFEGNGAIRGGAINTVDNEDNLTIVQIRKAKFIANVANEQGGALNISDSNVNIENALFSSNIANDPGTGGCISQNASDSLGSSMALLNCTFANNLGLLGAAIAQWENEGQLGAEATLTVQNTIFADALDSYAIEAGTPTVTSLGGNLSLDASMASAFTATNDVSTADPLFTDPANDDFHISAASPAINTGIAAGAPTEDLDGKPRDAQPDKGAYEAGSVAAHQPLQVEKMAISPNPVSDMAFLTMENAQTGRFQLTIMAADGQVLVSKSVEKAGKQLRADFDASRWPQGAYILTLEKDGKRASRAFIKQ